MARPSPLTVAVLNTSADVVELLRVLLEQNGYVVVSAHLDDIKRGAIDLEQMVRQHRPAAIVYDIAPPYDRQWMFLDHVRGLDALQGIPFVADQHERETAARDRRDGRSDLRDRGKTFRPRPDPVSRERATGRARP